ncbi:hypothetical protein HOF65_03675 [bacterium]|nr:hypothetical protein [bacterium]MBT3853077.1 hypothetical protein [bacterium]MBT4633565.1 hypothetical protein [bacterium]MBT5491383.1 hypothetical protein [bacterium]MBT6778613.1 hypothetical protein [bacterium]
MKKLLYIFLSILFMSSCSNPLDFREKASIEDINLDIDEIIIDINEDSLLDQTTEEDIDDLIDILFDTNID